MKLADIKPNMEVAARVRVNTWSEAVTRRCTVKSLDGRHVNLTAPTLQGDLSRYHRVYFTQVLATWEDYVAEKAKAEAAQAAERKRQNEAWEAKRAAERERFEQHILPAFRGLPTYNWYTGMEGQGMIGDLAAYIEDAMVVDGSSTVTLRESDLRAVADRITELQRIVEQTALTKDDLPQAGWGVPTSVPSEPGDTPTLTVAENPSDTVTI